MGTFAIIIILLVVLFFIRGSIQDDAEKTGRDICPKCGCKMEMGATARYRCPNCGYHQGHGYS